MQLTLSLQLKQERRLAQELKQGLRAQIELLQVGHFGYVTFEGDDDLDLLQESLPFLMMHEFAHALEWSDKVYIPRLSPTGDLPIAQSFYMEVFNQTREVGIDRAGIIAGMRACDFTYEDMIQSHTAMTERVVRDMYDEKLPQNLALLARLHGAAQAHKGQVRVPYSVEHRIDSIAERIDAFVLDRMPDSTEIYEYALRESKRMYENTTLISSPASSQ